MLMISFIVPAIFSPIDLVLPMTPPKEPDCPGQPVRRLPVPSATRLRSHAGASRNYIMPALQRRMLGFDRKAGCLGRKVDRDDSGNVGRREFISRNERYLGEPDVEVSVEIPDALLASFDQRRDLIVIMRTGKARFLRPGTALRTASITAANPSSSARRSHMITNAFIFGVAPSSGGSGWISQIAQDGRHFTDRGAVLQYQ